MKAQKVTVVIKIEALSIDVLRGLLTKVVEQVDAECENGSLTASDGDLVEWETKRADVEFQPFGNITVSFSRRLMN